MSVEDNEGGPPEPWRLTDDDETALHLASIRGTTAEVVYTREELHSAVESIKEAAWRAGQVAALEEAAADIREHRRTGVIPEGHSHYPYSEGFESWLRARAAELRGDR